MTKLRHLLFIAMVLVICSQVWITTSAPVTSITVNNADALADYSYTSSASLATKLSAVAARVVVGFSQAVGQHALTTPASSLMSDLNALDARIVVGFSQAMQREALIYPETLINDTTPPAVGSLPAISASATSATITWTTDEFATSHVRYGTSPGNYSQTVVETDYVKEHSIRITGLVEGETYYFKVVSRDQSGNTFESREQSIELTSQTYVFLPIVIR